jgi:hypothetical protein
MRLNGMLTILQWSVFLSVAGWGKAPHPTYDVFATSQRKERSEMISRKILLIIVLMFVFLQTSTAQIDTTRREFYPLGLGDLWQYRNDGGQLISTPRITRVDTLLPNGGIYAVRGPSPGGFDRIDSLLRVQWYAPWAADSCGGSFLQEASQYRLWEDSGAVWVDCYNRNGFLGPARIRFAGRRFQLVFGQMREILVFQFGYITPETGDTVWPSEERLARGIGLIWRDVWWRLGYEYLAGAVINGDTLGVVVSVTESHERLPSVATLYQNYPNPFNPSTVIRYEVPGREFVSLKVYNILGQEITKVVEGFQESGLYEVAYEAGDLASGVYFYRLNVGTFTQTKKLVLMR